MTLEGSTNDSINFILDFIKLCPRCYSSNDPEGEEYKRNHDPESEIDFDANVKFSLLLATTHLIIQNELPKCFQQPRFKIQTKKDLDFRSELVKFDTKLINFDLGKLHSDFRFDLNSESLALLAEINKLVDGMDCFEEGWNYNNESLVLQLYELFERADSTILKMTKQTESTIIGGTYLWSTAFDFLTFYLSINSGEEAQSAIDRVLLDRYCRQDSTELTNMEPMMGFPLAYHMFGLDNEDGLANALTYLEATIGN